MDSVGPYVLITLACGNLALSCFAVSFVRTSPQNRNALMLPKFSSLKSASPRHISENEGVDTQYSISDDAIYFSISGISCCNPLSSAMIVDPVARPVYKSITDRSKEKGA